MQEWEHYLNVREREIEVKDDNLSKMMNNLRIKDDKIDSQSDENRGLKHEIDTRVCCAKEKHDREWEVGVPCDYYSCV